MEKVVTFIKPAGRKAMIQVKVEGEDRNRWCFCSEAVVGFVKKIGYKEGDKVTVTYEIKDNSWNVSKVTGNSAGGTSRTDNTSTSPVNNESKAERASTGNFRAKSPEIVEENLTTAVSVTLNALQGHVNLDNVYTIIDKLYDSYVANAINAIKKLGG